jgi:hypothetical protein
MQPPIRIKLYGLISLTKRGYLLWAAVGGVGLVALLVVWAVTVGPPMPGEKAGQFAVTPWYVWRTWAPWLIGAGALLGGIEAYFVLKRFRRAEAERQQAAAPGPTPKGS